MLRSGNFLLIINRFASTLRTVDRPPVFPSNDHLGTQMKRLNDAKRFKESLALFDLHKLSNTTDLSINLALKASIHLKDFQRGLTIHKQLSSRSLQCRYIRMSLVQLYSEFVHFISRRFAQRVFSSVPIHQRTVFLYTAMLNGNYIVSLTVQYVSFTLGLVWHDRLEEALTLCEKMTLKPDQFIVTIIFDICGKLADEKAFQFGQKIFSQMDKNYFQNTTIMNSALNMFMRNADVAKAEEIFHSIKSKDLITYNSTLKGYNLNDYPLRTLSLFERMKKENIKIDYVTYVLACQACSQIGMIEYSRSIASQIPRRFLDEQILQNTLIDMWASKILIDRLIYNSMLIGKSWSINAFGLNGQGSRAVDLYMSMPEQMRDQITYTCVLNACSHSGLLNEARSIFEKISPKTLHITTAMVSQSDFRLHMFDEAETLVNDFERFHSPFAMMSGARTQCNTSLSEKLLVKINTRFPDLPERSISALILLGNTYSSTGDSNRSLDIRKQIQRSHVKPQIGQSWTCIDNQITGFRANDWFHPCSQQIHREAQRLAKELIEHGHKFDPRWITRSLGPDETIESVLSTHSERLAIAFNFIQKSIPSPIQITKNLRICGDCRK
uniref:Putative vegetative storage protein-like protein n=1 Tax=Philodina roseola TaxID=96448 RepID=B3G4P4_PHIRO|nr:putative vegetative storage protein-like protein [Philodina roseola]